MCVADAMPYISHVNQAHLTKLYTLHAAPWAKLTSNSSKWLRFRLFADAYTSVYLKYAFQLHSGESLAGGDRLVAEQTGCPVYGVRNQACGRFLARRGSSIDISGGYSSAVE